MLTAKQENFAQAVALEGMSYSEAYRTYYKADKMTDKSVWDASSKLASHPEVSQRIDELRKQTLSPKIMSAQKRREWLTEVIGNEDVDINARLKASDQLNKMDGEYVQKVEGSLNVCKLEDLL